MKDYDIKIKKATEVTFYGTENDTIVVPSKVRFDTDRDYADIDIEGVENAIQAAYTNYLTSFTELQTQRKSVELATHNYRIIENRYENGLALVSDMTDAANVKLETELALVNARINVIYNYYQLKYLSNTL